MDILNIEDLTTSPLKKIKNSKGDILHALKKNEESYYGFGEAYFSEIKHNQIKGWTLHNRMTLNLIVPVGKVAFVVYDNRKKSKSYKNFSKIIISKDNFKRLTIPPNLWVAFKGIDANLNLILNIASIEHNQREMEKKELEKIKYSWDTI